MKLAKTLMTKRQELIEEKREAKRQMLIHRPLREYMGNRYNQAYAKWKRLDEEIKAMAKHRKA